jgi:hypothetical protein
MDDILYLFADDLIIQLAKGGKIVLPSMPSPKISRDVEVSDEFKAKALKVFNAADKDHR